MVIKKDMKIKELRELLSDPMLDENLEIGYPDDVYEPTGVVPIERVTEVFDGFHKVIGYVIV